MRKPVCDLGTWALPPYSHSPPQGMGLWGEAPKEGSSPNSEIWRDSGALNPSLVQPTGVYPAPPHPKSHHNFHYPPLSDQMPFRKGRLKLWRLFPWRI